jgi:hypothetical protein
VSQARIASSACSRRGRTKDCPILDSLEANGWCGRMKEPKRARLEWFSWSGFKSARRAKVEDLALCITKDGSRPFADRPARIADIRRHATGAIIYLEREKNTRRKSLGPLVRRLGQRAAKLKSLIRFGGRFSDAG